MGGVHESPARMSEQLPGHILVTEGWGYGVLVLTRVEGV